MATALSAQKINVYYGASHALQDVSLDFEAGGVTVIPVCKISIGYGSGGSDFAQKNQKPENPNAFGGGAGMGVSITPISFLVIRDGNVRMVSVDQPASTVVDRVIDLVPGVVDKVSAMVSKKKDGEPAAEILEDPADA